MGQRPNVKEIVDQLELQPHPEGGYFRETYRSAKKVKCGDGISRNAGTGIYFLLPVNVCTNWHRVRSDELWHFYKGDKLVLEIIDEDGDFKQCFLGDDFSQGQFQGLVPENCWQRAYSTGDYSLVGCTVSPGFEFDDFEMVEPKALADQHPDIATKIMHNPFSDN